MARTCVITGKRVMTGNNVSHAHNRTRRRFLPNLQKASFVSDSLGISVRMRVSTSAIRTIEHRGGLDAYVLGIKDNQLPAKFLTVKKMLQKKAAA